MGQCDRSFASLRMTEGILRMTEGILRMTEGILRMTEGILRMTEGVLNMTDSLVAEDFRTSLGGGPYQSIYHIRCQM